MKRIRVIPAIAILVALLLAGCNGALPTLGDGSSVAPIDLTNPDVVAALCDDSANKVLEVVKPAGEANPNSGQRNALAEWGVAEPSDNTEVKEVISTLEKRAATPCKDVAAGSDKVGVHQHDGSVDKLPLVEGNGDTLIIDTTDVEATPPLMPAPLDGDRFTVQSLSWEGFVERAENDPWYIDGWNKRHAASGMTWSDALKFAEANKIVNGKIQGVNALAIQVFNRPDLSDEAVRAEVREYITPVEEKIIGLTVEELPIQRINGGFVNTRNVGTKGHPIMDDFFDKEKMVRVSLMPLNFNKSGKAVSIDGSRGAGAFIDCGNLHWQPLAMWVCKGKGCEKPECPAGTVGTPPNCDCPKGMNGTPPNCYNPPEGCSHNCNPPTCKHDCEPLTPKDWSKNRSNEGFIPLETGKLTDGNRSSDQKASGKTSGNVVDNKVPSGTKSNDTTPDLPAGTVTAPGATKNEKPKTGEPVEDTSNDVVDEEATNQNDGGTSGDTEIVDPDG